MRGIWLAMGAIVVVTTVTLLLLPRDQPGPSLPAVLAVPRPAPTAVVMRVISPPIAGHIDVLNAAGVSMTAEQSGGEPFFLPNGTTVQMLQAAGALSQVQVMSGQYRNRVGWIPTNAVST
jgi:hypothetical protein